MEFFIQNELYPPNITDVTFEGRAITIVTYSKEMHEAAVNIANMIRIYHTTHYNGSEDSQRIENSQQGFIGQLSFLTLLYLGDWQIALREIPIGRADKGDFRYHGWVANVKTVYDGRNLCVKLAEISQPVDLYALVWLRHDLWQAWVMGWAWRKEVKVVGLSPKLKNEPGFLVPWKGLHEPKEALSIPQKSSDREPGTEGD